MNELKAELKKLYADASKHSVYQNVPDFVSAELGYAETIDEAWRGDRPRLAYLAGSRTPAPGERWLDFGANTGFFALNLAKQYPLTSFYAVEANPNHARFIARVAKYFQLDNVEVIDRAIGLNDLHELPKTDFLLHLNVLHHAGHDFDADLVPSIDRFPDYARDYLSLLRDRTKNMFFQMGSNWCGNKMTPLVGVRDDAKKLQTFATWLEAAGWRIEAVAYPEKGSDERVSYRNLVADAGRAALAFDAASGAAAQALSAIELDVFPGEFYRRPLFLCNAN